MKPKKLNEAFKILLDNGKLTLVNNRIEAAQRAESERIYTENVQFVRDSLAVLDPEFLEFIETPILDDDINDPSGNNWHHTITHNSGETSIVTTLGKTLNGGGYFIVRNSWGGNCKGRGRCVWGRSHHE
ncbi:MAG: hypothetical protein K8S13_13905 [Desulfobacula sp.]|uniref:hypothetical protein n=1 Tax=Desulfobacula sp. TaxID=2593537 RepID=UPI0025C69D49|nr:hypothetical protein [Desulfobacula sp.]MCD4720932.1 hypothetical protein [Desulfobacula sp.]